jgi:hypothetical protein
MPTASSEGDPARPEVPVVRGLADITFVPTAVRIRVGSDFERIDEQMRAHLFAEREGEVVTVVCSNVYGDPFFRVAKLVGAIVQPGGGRSPWRLTLELRDRSARTSSFVFDCEFPTDPVLIIQGEHIPDFASLNFPPLSKDAQIRSRCESYAQIWSCVASHCAALAGPGRLLLDTPQAATRWQQERLQEQRRIAIAEEERA